MAASLTLRLDEHVVDALDDLAAESGQSRERLVEQAIENFIALRSWQTARIEAGIAPVDRGDFAAAELLKSLPSLDTFKP